MNYDTPHSQGIRRIVLGRAYYAAFLDAREKVRRKYPKQLAGHAGKIRVHQHVRDLLKELKAANISDKLHALFEYREKADYDLHSIIDVTDMESSVLLSENIIQLVRDLKIS